MKATPEQINHPYMKTLEGQLQTAKRKKELLEIRVKFLTDKISLDETSPFDCNEAEIKIIDTNSEISALTRLINEKEAYFMKFMQGYIEDMDEVESNFVDVKARAYEKAVNDPELKKVLDKIVWDALEKDTEAKIYYYKQLKKRINP